MNPDTTAAIREAADAMHTYTQTADRADRDRFLAKAQAAVTVGADTQQIRDAIRRLASDHLTGRNTC